jgi:hypothetical protein
MTEYGDAVRRLPVTRIESGRLETADDHAAVEEPLQVMVNGEPFAVIMRSPMKRHAEVKIVLDRGPLSEPALAELWSVTTARGRDDVPHPSIRARGGDQDRRRRMGNAGVASDLSCGSHVRPGNISPCHAMLLTVAVG